MNKENMTVNEAAKLNESDLSELINHHAPEIEKIIKIKTRSEWYNADILNPMKRAKRKSERKWLISKSNQDLITFKNLRNKFTVNVVK